MTSLKVAESRGEVPLNDRIISLIFMTEIWITKPLFIARHLERAPDNILAILKRASRDILLTLSQTSIELLFRLLESFAKSRNQHAPQVYKILTFLLVEFYWETEVREMMLRHFIWLFKHDEGMPVKILCEPLLKQIEVSQYHSASFNVFDFEFFEVIARHPKLNLQTALPLMDSLSKISLTSVGYQKISNNILASLFERFQVS